VVRESSEGDGMIWDDDVVVVVVVKLVEEDEEVDEVVGGSLGATLGAGGERRMAIIDPGGNELGFTEGESWFVGWRADNDNKEVSGVGGAHGWVGWTSNLGGGKGVGEGDQN